MKYVFVCPKCKEPYYAEFEAPFSSADCPDCKLNAKYIGITKSEWDALDQLEKDKIVNDALADYKLPRTQYLVRLSNDVHTIKNIIVWLVVLAAFFGIVVLLIK